MKNSVSFKKIYILSHMMAIMSLKAEASRTFLSYLWWILEPVLYVLVYYVVFSVILQNKTEDFLYFLIVGKIPFLWFQKTIQQGSNSYVRNKNLISTGGYSLNVFPLSVLIETSYKQIIVFLLLIAFMIANGFELNQNYFYLPFIICYQIILQLIIVHICSFLVVIAKDFQTIISMWLLMMLFISGIFWNVREIDNTELIVYLMYFNPVAFILDSYRSVFLNYDIYSVPLLTCSIVLSCILLFIVSKITSIYSINISNILVSKG